MHFLMMPIGTAGDVHPLIGIGRELKSRGHRVSIFTHTTFGGAVREAGLDFWDAEDADDYRATFSNPIVWDERRGHWVVMPFYFRLMPKQFEAIRKAMSEGPTVVVAEGGAFGARVAHDALNVPMVTIHTCPVTFRSVERPAIEPIWFRLRTGWPWFTRTAYAFFDYFFVDPLLSPINTFRQTLGLAPVRRFMNGWWNSPQMVIGMFPKWFGNPAPDWPPQTRLTGFPLHDPGDDLPLPPDLVEFLEAGTPPIVFSPGSAIRPGAGYYATAVEVCRLLRRRGLFLTKHAPPPSVPLPEYVRHVPYAPFRRLLPHTAALVHHGGIGSTGQAFLAGIPQIIRPLAYDQPDNAERAVRHGVARTVVPRQFRAKLVARHLRELLENHNIIAHCKALAEQVKAEDGVVCAATAIEEMHART